MISAVPSGRAAGGLQYQASRERKKNGRWFFFPLKFLPSQTFYKSTDWQKNVTRENTNILDTIVFSKSWTSLKKL